MRIGLFATQEDQSYSRRLAEIIGAHHIKARFTPVEYFAVFAGQCKVQDLDAAILSCPQAIALVIKSLPEFRTTYLKNGKERTLAQDDYAGSLVVIPGYRIGRDRDLDVLILNPLHDLVRSPTGTFLFKRYVSKITQPQNWFPQTKFTHQVATEENLDELIDRFESALLIGVDIETDEDSPLRTISCSGYCGLFPDGSTHTIVLPMRSMAMVKGMQRLNALAAPKVMQGGLYDCAYFYRYNAPVRNYLYDTLHLFHSLYSELPKRLDFVASYAIREIRFWKNDGKTGNLVDHYEYNGRDCWATVMGCLALLREYPEWARRNYIEHEFSLVFPCMHVEQDGMRVDMEQFHKVKAEIEVELEAVMVPIRRWLGEKFNPRSSDQCKRLLQILGIKDPDSSDEQAMNAAAAIHPLNERILSEILEARGKLKLLSTYLVEEKFWNGRLHYKIDPAGTDTQRLSSKESAYWCGLQIQNIPAEESRIKSYCILDEGWDGFCEIDKSQSESWCTGYITGCKTLMDVLHGPDDFHSYNASAFFGVPYAEIYDNDYIDPKTQTKGKKLNKKLRDLSKRTNHGASYNMGPQVLLDTMGPKKVAEAKRLLRLPAKWSLIQVTQYLLNQFEKTYSEVKIDYQVWLKSEIGFKKKLTSALGWTRYFFNHQLSNKLAMNAAVAHVPQNLNAGMVNKEFYEIWRASLYGATDGRHVDLRGRVRMKATIHDSNFFGYRGEATPKIVQNMMRTTIAVKDIKGVTRNLTVPTDVKLSKLRWSDCE